MNRRKFLALGGTAAIGVVTYSTVTLSRARADEATTLTPVEAHAAANRGDILLVDVRRLDEWKDTGVGAGATPIDRRDDNFSGAVRAAQRDCTQPVALTCARGVRSARTTQRLVAAGFTSIIDVPEGMLGSRAGPGWLARDLPIVTYQR